MLRDGYAAGAAKIRSRAWEIYLWAMLVLVSLAVLAMAAPALAHAWSDWLGPLATPDAGVLVTGSC